MRTTTMASLAATLASLLLSAAAVAQEHWTDGPVWACSTYRTAPGQFDNYLKWIRTHVEPQNKESKKQGLVLDSKTFVQSPRDPNDWDVMFCDLYPSYGKALDYDKGDDDKAKAIEAKHWQTAEQDKQADLTKPRLEMRKYLGSFVVREANLRPMP
jgi:hypothetical protein